MIMVCFVSKEWKYFLRSLLTSYLLTNDGKFDEKAKINQFPNSSLFKNLGIDTSDDLEVVKNYVKAQEKINLLDANKIRFIKTHSSPMTLMDTNYRSEKYTWCNLYCKRSKECGRSTRIIINYL